MRLHAICVPLAAYGLIVSACGASDGADSFEPTPVNGTDAPLSTIVTVPQVPLVDAADPAPEGFHRVEFVDEIVGIWMPVEVGGETVDAATLGAYAQITLSGDSVRLNGFDGCNGIDGYAIDGVEPLEDGRLVGIEFSTEAQDCDIDIRVSPGADARLFVDATGDGLFADGIPFTGGHPLRAGRLDPRRPASRRSGKPKARRTRRRAVPKKPRNGRHSITLRSKDAEAIRTGLPEARTR